MPGVKKLSHRHTAIAHWLIANPERPLGDCAQTFGVSQAWLSCVIHSGAFQAYYNRLADEKGSIAVHSTHNRLQGLANLAMEKAAERIEQGATDRFLGDTMNNALRALGYGQGPAPIALQVNNDTHITVDGDLLRQAREASLNRKVGTTQVKLVEGLEQIA